MVDLVVSTVKKMLTENTGRHMLDSGGAYGRHWEKNQKNLPWNQPRIHVKQHRDRVSIADNDAPPYQLLEIEGPSPHGNVTMNVFHFLTEQGLLHRDAKIVSLERTFYRFAARAGRDGPHLPTMEEWAERRVDKPKKSLVDHFNGMKDVGPVTINTSNGEYGCSSLSQVLQWVAWHDDPTGKNLCLLQIHGGCDVRGGYTDPRLFECDDFFGPLVGEFGFRCFACNDKEWYESVVMGNIYSSKKPNDWPANAPKFDQANNRVLCPKCNGELSVS